MRVPTGVKGFDELIQGGLPEGACVVLEGPTGVEKTQFATGFLIEGLRRGEAILVVLASEPPSAFFEKLREKGFDPDRLYEEGRLRVVDWYSQREESVVEVEEVGVVIKSSLDLLNVGIAITRAIASLAKDSQKRAVVEILSPALSIYDLPQVHTFAQATKAKLSRHNLTTLFLVEREMHDSTTLSTLLQPFDGAIDIDRAREGDRIVRKLAVLSLKGTSAQSTYVPFDIAMDGSLELAGGAAETAPRKVETAGSDKPRDAGLWLSLGKMLAQSGRLEKALVSLESCTKIDPQNSEAWTLKADILRKMGRDDEAEEALAIIQVLGPASKAEPSKPAKPTRKSEKILRILESSEERLSKRKDDTDALFAKATALAALEQNDKALDTLNELTKVNHKYPGLWLLKAKIYAAAGDPDKAQLCRKRALETDREAEAQETPPLPEEIPEPQPPKVQFECPICNSLVDEEATQCPSCDAIFAEGAPAPPQPSLPPGKPKELPVPKAPDKSKVTPPPGVGKPPKVGRARAQKGRTNGLTNGLRGRTNGLTNGLRGRTNGLTNGLKGKTNGLKGRTNGLTNGLRGRTNGLTNGLRGRTNGLTNGLRGRTNGLTNGLRGRTNGLTNGVKQGAGKVNGLATEGRASGVTNGLVNGLRGLRTGITNGLTNGNGFTNGLGSGKFRRQARGYRWKLYTIPLVAFMLLIIPVMLPNVVRTPSYVIRIDGEFGDWASQRVVAMQPDPAVSPNIMIREVSVVDNLDYLSFYVEVQGSILQGGPQPERLMDSVRAFIDLDRSPTTGYLVRGVGAERMVEVWGWGGSAMIARVWEYGPSVPSDQDNWSAWGAPTDLMSAASGNRLETQVPWEALQLSGKGPIEVLFQTRAWDGEEQFAQHIVSNEPGILQLSQMSLAPMVISGNGVPLLGIEITSVEGAYALAEVRVQVIGTTQLSALSAVRLQEGMNTLDSRVPISRVIAFHPTQPIQVASGAIVSLSVVADVGASDGATLGINLASDKPVTVAGGSDPPGAVTTVNLSAQYPLGYLGFVPAGVVIDGGFGEWTDQEADAQGEPSTQGVASLDIAQYDSNLNGSASFYLRLRGTALQGTATPQPSLPAPNGTSPPVADTDKDTVPDAIDLYKYDFNNDGIPDNQTNHDVDGDGITDWPYGADMWLNTTIPSNFTAPYAGRVVNVNIGPSMRPPVKGDDYARFFVDVDNNTVTGYAIDGIGAEYMVEMRGREGRVRGASVFMHSGPARDRWAWTATGSAAYALEQDQMEVSGIVPGLTSASKVVYMTSDWRQSAWDTARSATRGTRGVFADGMPIGSTVDADTYVDEMGRVQTAELKLVKTNGKYGYMVEKNGMAAYFGRINDGSGLILLQRGDMSFSWQPSELGTLSDGVFTPASIAGKVAAESRDSQVAYDNLFPGVDDTYTVSLNKVKHDIVINSVSAVPRAGEYLVVRGKVLLSNGSVFAVNDTVQTGDFVSSSDVQIVSPSGVTLTLWVPFVQEQGNPEVRADGVLRAQKAGDGWILSMEVPLHWFLDSRRQYPVVLDPTGIIDTSTSTGPTSYHYQRKVFYDGTYFWAFYWDGTDTMYEYSSDGMSWVNTKAQAFTTAGVQYASVWYYSTGSIVYIAGDTTGANKFVFVRRGTISGTTITWGAEGKPAISAGGQASKAPFISRDSSGYIWVCGLDKEGATKFTVGVMRSTNTDDVSTWPAAMAIMFTNITTTYIQSSVVPLSGGDVYVVWYADGPIAGRKYSSSTHWGSVEDIETTLTTSYFMAPTALVDGSGYVNIVYISSAGNVLYRQRTTSWSSPTTLDGNSGNYFATISMETSSGDFYAFWKSSTAQIKCKQYTGGSWSSVTLETDTITKNWVTSIYNVSGSSKISWAWTETRSGTLYHTRFTMMSTSVASRTVDTSTLLPTSYSHQRKVFYDGAYFWAFYSDGTDSYYTYSSDGYTWLNGYTQVFTTAGVEQISVWYYGGATKKVYAAGDTSTADKRFYVRDGTISGTTITWGTEAHFNVGVNNLASKAPFICRDSSGYLWLVTNDKETNFNLAVVRSTNIDDISAWDAYTNLLSADIANNNIYGVIVPLASGNVYALWYANGAIDGKLYSGSWGTLENINTTSTVVSTKGPSVVVDSNNYVNLVFSDSTGKIIYRQRTTSWQTAQVVTTTTSNVYPSITLDSGTGNLYALWIDSSSQITGKKYSGGSWSSMAGIDTSTITKNYLTTVYSVSSFEKICWVWGQGGTTPYESKFQIIIPEFEDVLVPLAVVGLLPPFLGRRRVARRRASQNQDVPRQ